MIHNHTVLKLLLQIRCRNKIISKEVQKSFNVKLKTNLPKSLVYILQKINNAIIKMRKDILLEEGANYNGWHVFKKGYLYPIIKSHNNLLALVHDNQHNDLENQIKIKYGDMKRNLINAIKMVKKG